MITQFPWDVIEKYKLEEQAEKQIRELKLDSIPYNMQANNKIYCRVLLYKLDEFRKQMTEKQRDKICKMQTDGSDSGTTHNCYSIYNKSPLSCLEKCDFCKYEINPLVKSMEELQSAIDCLKEAAQKDYDLR